MRARIPLLLSFNGGFVDTAGFLGLQGLFTAHVTGNFVTLAATLLMGRHGVLAKILALPEFVIVVALARLADTALLTRGKPALRALIGANVALLLVFFVLAVVLGPFPDSDAPVALLTGFAGVAAMAVQNAIQRVYYARFPPTTIMTGNTTQAALDLVDLRRAKNTDAAAVRLRFAATVRAIIVFAAGCAAAAALYAWFGFWCLAVPMLAGIVILLSQSDD